MFKILLLFFSCLCFENRHRQGYQVFSVANGHQFETKKCQIVPKNATSIIIENHTFGDQIRIRVILPNKKQLKWRDGIFWAKLEFYFENNSPILHHFEQLASLDESLNYSKEL